MNNELEVEIRATLAKELDSELAEYAANFEAPVTIGGARQWGVAGTLADRLAPHVVRLIEDHRAPLIAEGEIDTARIRADMARNQYAEPEDTEALIVALGEAWAVNLKNGDAYMRSLELMRKRAEQAEAAVMEARKTALNEAEILYRSACDGNYDAENKLNELFRNAT